MDWWVYRIPLIAMQIIAFFPYTVGSYRFFRGKNHQFLLLIGIGIILDVIIGGVGSLGFLPKPESFQTGAPWESWIFRLHVFFGGIGLFGFIAVFLYTFFKGMSHQYKKLRSFQFRFLLTSWWIGVIIALSNFFTKVLIGARLYDYF